MHGSIEPSRLQGVDGSPSAAMVKDYSGNAAAADGVPGAVAESHAGPAEVGGGGQGVQIHMLSGPPSSARLSWC